MSLSALLITKMNPDDRFSMPKSAAGAYEIILGFFFAMAFLFAANGSSAQEFRPFPAPEIFATPGDISGTTLPGPISPLRPGTLLGRNTGWEATLQYRPEPRKPVLSWETGSGKSYLIPAVEIPGFVLVANIFGRLALSADKNEEGNPAYDTNLSTFWNHLVHGPWTIDTDDFRTNQLKHPYQGAIYQGFARSAGLGFWASAAYTFAGSFLWETAGETTRPSINDQIASGIAGNFLGEPLFRVASLILESTPGFWGELAAAFVSPPTAFNRLVFGDRFAAVFPSHGPAVFSEGRLGYSRNVYKVGGDENDFQPDQATLDFLIAYGLPGKPGYHYTRPFDYFQLEFTAISSKGSPIENVMTRGLLIGSEYSSGESYRGVWGLYGSYDFISPGFFRVSSSALSVGTTGQWWLSRSVALQGTALAGLGYGAGGNIVGAGQRNYHYGATPQGLLSLRLSVGDRARFEATLREYYISDVLATDPPGSETITRLNLGFLVRLFGRHAVGLQYLFSSRQGDYTDLINQHQRTTTISFVYTYLSDIRFGAVEWRENQNR